MKQIGIILSLLFFGAIYGYFLLEFLYLNELVVDGVSDTFWFKLLISFGTLLSYVILHQFNIKKTNTALLLLAIVSVNYLNSLLLTLVFDISYLLSYGVILISLTIFEVLLFVGWRYWRNRHKLAKN